MTIKIPVLSEVTEANSILAGSLRSRFAEQRVLVLNLMASPGAGKTTLLERSIEELDGSLRMAVIEGDPHTSIDAERIDAAGVKAVEINTGGGCHLEARMVQAAVEQIDSEELDLIVIENVGNLICPTGWDLGEDVKVILVSLTEGDDKPLKYPMGFLTADAAVISKIDLEPYIPAKTSAMRENALTVNPDLEVFELSAITGEGMEPFVRWVKERVAEKQAQAG
jgi:hydrogenase nickel incorporation protein HypB